MKNQSVIEHNKGIKCSTYGASQKGELAFGDFAGKLNIIDIETRKVNFNLKIYSRFSIPLMLMTKLLIV
jgi:hypothetical protein